MVVFGVGNCWERNIKQLLASVAIQLGFLIEHLKCSAFDKYLCKINFLFEKSVSLAGQGTEPNRMYK